MLVEPDGAALASLADLVDAGRLRVAIDTVLPIEKVARAHEIGQAGRAQGKIILDLGVPDDREPGWDQRHI